MVELGQSQKGSGRRERRASGADESGGPAFADVVGQRDLKDGLLAVAANDDLDGLLVSGEKGTAKSTTVRALADLLPDQRVVADCPYGCDPDDPAAQCADCQDREDPPVAERPVPLVTLPLGATRERVLGSLSVADAMDGERSFDPGLLARANRGILYVDEVNLLDDHLVDVLLDAAASGTNRVERDGVSVAHPADVTLVGTMNPEEGDLRPQLRDRFAITAEVTACEDLADRVRVIERGLGTDEAAAGSRRCEEGRRPPERRLAGARERLAADDVTLGEDLLRKTARVCRTAGVDGHRGDLAVARTARTLAALDDRERVTESDLERAVRFALPHRLRSDPFEDAPDLEAVIEEHFDEEDAGEGDEESRGDGDGGESAGEDERGSTGGDGRGSTTGGDAGDGSSGERGEAGQEHDGTGRRGQRDGQSGEDGDRPSGNGDRSDESRDGPSVNGDGRAGEAGDAPSGGGEEAGGERSEAGTDGDGKHASGEGHPEGSTDADGHPSGGSDGDEIGGDATEAGAIPDGAAGSDDGGTGDAPAPERSRGDDEAPATPLVPGQERESRDPGSSADLQVDSDGAADGTRGARGDGAAAEGTDVDGPRVRTRRTDGREPVDAAASLRAAARRGGEGVERRDLRASVRRRESAALVTFVVDASASMRPAMRAAKATVLELLRDAYEHRDEVAVVACAGPEAEVLVPPTDSVPTAARHLKELPAGDRTPLVGGLRAGIEVLDRADPAASAVVVVTDGRANVAERPTAATRALGRRLAERDAAVMVVDAGEDRDRAGVTDVLARSADAEVVGLDALSAARVDALAAQAGEAE